MIVPASVENRNTDGPDVDAFVTVKSVLPLYTRPVGPPATSTTNGMMAPVPSYRVETSLSAAFTHHGVVGPAARPQALTRFGSVAFACPG